jgi:hypothetical protein
VLLRPSCLSRDVLVVLTKCTHNRSVVHEYAGAGSTGQLQGTDSALAAACSHAPEVLTSFCFFPVFCPPASAHALALILRSQLRLMRQKCADGFGCRGA